MTNKRTISFSLILIAFLFQACQESPTRVGNIDNANELTNELGGGVQTTLQGPGGPGGLDDPCLDVNGNPILDCEGDGTNDPGNGGSTAKISFFHKGNTTDGIFYSTSTNGETWGTNQLVTNGAQTSRGPAAAYFNNALYVFYKGRTGNNIFYSYKGNTGGWLGNLYLSNGVKTQSDLAATVHEGYIYVAHQGETNDAIYLSYSSNGTTWSGNIEVLPSSEDVDHFDIISYRDDVYVFYIADKKLYYKKTDTPMTSSAWASATRVDRSSGVGRDIKYGVSAAVTVGLTNVGGAPQTELLVAHGTRFSFGFPFPNPVERKIYLQEIRKDVDFSTGTVIFTGSNVVSTTFESENRPSLVAMGEKLILLNNGVSTDNNFYYVVGGNNGVATGKSELGGVYGVSYQN